jgi:hypothetical protein
VSDAAPDVTPSTFTEGDVLQDPDTKAVAVRTAPNKPKEWAVMTVDNGGHYASWSRVSSWQKLVPAAKTAARKSTK